ncbi:FBD-associated F-box protein [Quillaja saponaria]|uniref:FBD-associated F-box protein n=1 Tax=Quillaja saponaria TaxID=32244 RepID=A0AAD7KV00_QUISA|nr:FBD-associated F-box protein [Quillaja saponaria]
MDGSVFLKLASSICFSSLRSLTLKYVVFPHDKSTKLFSGCPVLLDLTLDKCGWWNVKCVTIAAPMLELLTIEEHEDNHDNF